MAAEPPPVTVGAAAALTVPGPIFTPGTALHARSDGPPAVSTTVQPSADASAAITHGPASQAEQQTCKCNPGGRNLIVCIDGTSNQFSEKNTNVVELYSRLAKDDTQLTFYNSGIGTYATPSWKSLSYYTQQILNKLDLAFAVRFEKIIISAYAWLADNYQPGDRIFLFGFSRGAYQVRALSAMIDIMGIIHKGNDDQIPFAYELYAAGQGLPSGAQSPVEGTASASSAAASRPTPTSAMVSAHPESPQGPLREMARLVWCIFWHVFCVFWHSAFRFLWDRAESAVHVTPAPRANVTDMQKRFKSAFARDAKVHFVGVWDTVSSVGIARSKTLPGTTDGMEHACYFRHALAIHECRVKFLPEYVNGGLGPAKAGPFRGDPNEASYAVRSSRPSSKEVWFSGSHSDIGGGATNNLELDQFGPSLRWMSFEARVAGVRFMQEPQLSDDAKLDHTPSLTRPWRFLEILPFRRLTYDSADGTTRMPHLAAPRVFQKDQLICWDVTDEDKKKFGLNGMEKEADPYKDALKFVQYLNAALETSVEHNSASMDEFGSLRESLRSLLLTVAGQQSLCRANLDSDIVRQLLAILKICIGITARDELRDVVSLALFGLVFGFDGTDGLKACCDPQQAVTMFFDSLDQNISSMESLDKHQKDMLRVLKSTDAGRAALQTQSARAVGASRRVVGFPVSRSTDLFDAIASILAVEGVAYPLGVKSGAAAANCDVLAVGCGVVHILAERSTSGTLPDLNVRDKEMLKVLRRADKSLIGPAFDELTERILPWLLTLLRVYSLIKPNPDDGASQSNTSAIIQDARHIYDGFSVFQSSETSETHLHEILQLGSKGTEWTVPQILGHRNTVSTVLFLSDTKIASSSWDGTICIWDILTGENVSPPIRGHEAGVNCLAVCQSRFLVSGSNDRTCIVWNSETGQAILQSQPLDERISAVACHPSVTRVAIGTFSGNVYLLDFSQGPFASLCLANSMFGEVSCMAFSPINSNLLAVGYGRSAVFLWDLASRQSWQLHRHIGPVHSVAFSRDGKFLASGSDGAAIVVWHIEMISNSYFIQGDGDPMWSVAYSPDGRHIVSATGGILQLWDAQTGQKAGMALRGHRGTILSLAWSPDGSRIASGANDKSIHIWDRVPFPRTERGS